MEVDLRVRLYDRLLKRTGAGSIVGKGPAQIRRLQERPEPPHNRMLDALFGGVAPGVRLEDRSVPTREGSVRVRVYTPQRVAAPLPVVVHFHGGGWTLGNLRGWDWVCSTVAAQAGALVVSVAYRLAPFHPFPAAVHDAYDATVWVAAHAPELGGDPRRLAVMGDSAGGNLAAVVSLLARDSGGPALGQQILTYPATDLTLSARSLVEKADAPLLTRADVEAFVGFYLSGGADPRDPYVSPLLAPDLAGLPPALILTAEHDCIRDDGRRYAQRLRAAGVPVRFTEYAGMPHGFLSLPGLCRFAPQALAEIAAELRARLAPAGAPQ